MLKRYIPYCPLKGLQICFMNILYYIFGSLVLKVVYYIEILHIVAIPPPHIQWVFVLIGGWSDIEHDHLINWTKSIEIWSERWLKQFISFKSSKGIYHAPLTIISAKVLHKLLIFCGGKFALSLLIITIYLRYLLFRQ